MTWRIALQLEYDGSAFHGWQMQRDPALPTVQETLEAALSRIADHPLKLSCAGRTDTGVHATGQVVHFNARTDRGARAWVTGGNSLLPPSVRIHWAGTVERRFHARFAALSRRYRYIIHESPVASAVLARQVTHCHERLDAAAMDRAGALLLGENDFSAFRAAGCQSSSPFRNVTRLSVRRHQAFIVIDIEANAFLQHMVRNIAGALLEVGRGRRPPEWITELLAGRDRRQGAMTASPNGLYLVDVAYPPEFGLPRDASGPVFLPPADRD